MYANRMSAYLLPCTEHVFIALASPPTCCVKELHVFHRQVFPGMICGNTWLTLDLVWYSSDAAYELSQLQVYRNWQRP
jgi:hypothetical protein